MPAPTETPPVNRKITTHEQLLNTNHIGRERGCTDEEHGGTNIIDVNVIRTAEWNAWTVDVRKIFPSVYYNNGLT